MKGRDFFLEPFAPTAWTAAVTMSGSIARRAEVLAIRYVLRGRLAELVIPDRAARPARRHGLWEGTCCEIFLGVKDLPGYWEFNLSPAGDWNVYRFEGYRQGMTEEPAFTSLALSVRRPPDRLEVALELEIGKIAGADQPLAVGLAAVIEFRDQGLTYWALTHPGAQPDFHRRDGFQMEL
jgi:hypothetical protein